MKTKVKEKAQQPQDNGRSLCLCGHTGDTPLAAGMNTSQHTGQIGHGACMVPGCTCQKFTWAQYRRHHV